MAPRAVDARKRFDRNRRFRGLLGSGGRYGSYGVVPIESSDRPRVAGSISRPATISA